MENPSVYAGEPELMALVDVVQHPIYFHQILTKIVLEKIVSKLLLLFISSIHLSKKTTASTPKQAAHYGLLLDVLYPKTRAFIAIKGGETSGTWLKYQILTTAFQRLN